MGLLQIIIIVICLTLIVALGLYLFLLTSGSGRQSSLLNSVGQSNLDASAAARSAKSSGRVDIDEVKRRTGSAKVKQATTDDLETKFFKAGIFSEREKRRFFVIRIVVFFVVFIGLPTAAFIFIDKPLLVVGSVILGAIVGFIAPLAALDRMIEWRNEETLYYLPLVIEQISIGVSSSLDIGPSVAHIVAMADERDSHNPVTEMFVHVDKLMKSGLSLDEAMTEVGEANGLGDVKHAFMFLSQCARHGGEISKQLQELADAIMVQRQMRVEAKITSLPVKATGPLAMVFAGFFLLIMAGLFVRVMQAFSSV